MNLTGNLPSAMPLAGSAASTSPFAKAMSGKDAKPSGDPASAFGDLLSEQLQPAGKEAGGVGQSASDTQHAAGDSPSLLRQRKAFEAKLDEVIGKSDDAAASDRTSVPAGIGRSTGAARTAAIGAAVSAGLGQYGLPSPQDLPAASVGAFAQASPQAHASDDKSQPSPQADGDASLSRARPKQQASSASTPDPSANISSPSLNTIQLVAAGPPLGSAGPAPRGAAASQAATGTTAAIVAGIPPSLSAPALSSPGPAPTIATGTSAVSPSRADVPAPNQAAPNPRVSNQVASNQVISNPAVPIPSAAIPDVPSLPAVATAPAVAFNPSMQVIASAALSSAVPNLAAGLRGVGTISPAPVTRGASAAVSTPSANQIGALSVASLRAAPAVTGPDPGQQQIVADRAATGQGGSPSWFGSGNAARDLAHAAQPVAVVSVVSQETHAAPVMQLSPVQQISDSIVSAAVGASSTETLSAANPLIPAPAAKSMGALQVLNIQLDPPDLGSVSVKMRLTGDKLDLNIEVSRKETISVLDKSGDSLSSSLQSSGYTVDSLTIKSAETGSLSAQHQHQPSGGEGQAQGQPQGQQSAFQSSGHSGQSGAQPGSTPSGDGRQNDRSSANSNGNAPDSNRNAVVEDVTVKNSRSGDLYL